MGFYERHILPTIITCACGARPIQRQRMKIAPWIEGTVLEVGFGSGNSLPFFDAARVTKIIGVEPEEGMRRLGAKAAARQPIPAEVLDATAETAPIAPGSIDTVLFSYTLCTIPDPASALASVKKYLKPEGKLVFCEHGLAPDEDVRRTQRKVEPWWSRLAGGCRLTREPRAMIEGAGYRIETCEQMYLPKSPRFAGFNVWGTARPA